MAIFIDLASWLIISIVRSVVRVCKDRIILFPYIWLISVCYRVLKDPNYFNPMAYTTLLKKGSYDSFLLCNVFYTCAFVMIPLVSMSMLFNLRTTGIDDHLSVLWCFKETVLDSFFPDKCLAYVPYSHILWICYYLHPLRCLCLFSSKTNNYYGSVILLFPLN